MSVRTYGSSSTIRIRSDATATPSLKAFNYPEKGRVTNNPDSSYPGSTLLILQFPERGMPVDYTLSIGGADSNLRAIICQGGVASGMAMCIQGSW